MYIFETDSIISAACFHVNVSAYIFLIFFSPAASGFLLFMRRGQGMPGGESKKGPCPPGARSIKRYMRGIFQGRVVWRKVRIPEKSAAWGMGSSVSRRRTRKSTVLVQRFSTRELMLVSSGSQLMAREELL